MNQIGLIVKKIIISNIKKKLYSSNSEIKQNKQPIKTSNNFNNIKTEKLSKNYSFTPKVNSNYKKNNNKNKKLSLNKNNNISNNIIDEEINKKINIIINKYSI